MTVPQVVPWATQDEFELVKSWFYPALDNGANDMRARAIQKVCNIIKYDLN